MEIVDRLLRVNPNERYQSATEVLADMRSALAQSDEKPKGAGAVPRLSTVMCVESRVKQQDMLREYLSKHGFRVLMLSNWDRALSRLKSNPPDCLLLMGESTGEINHGIYAESLRWCQTQGLACVIVLPVQESEQKARLRLNSASRVLTAPVTLRELRGAIIEALQAHFNRE
jgi:DNA-binding response OmpR family regulator